MWTHLVPHITDLGFSAAEASGILSLIGGTSVVSKIIMGSLSDRIGRKLTATICSVLQVGALVWLIWAREPWMFYLFALVFGFSYGGIGPCSMALIGDIFGAGKIGPIMGVVEVSFGIGAAIGPLIGGLVFDATGNYSIAFAINAVGMTIATLLMALTKREIHPARADTSKK